MNKICSIDIKKAGIEYIAVVTHHVPPVGDNRDEPVKDFTARNYEDLLMEVKRYIEDCYDE